MVVEHHLIISENIRENGILRMVIWDIQSSLMHPVKKWIALIDIPESSPGGHGVM